MTFERWELVVLLLPVLVLYFWYLRARGITGLLRVTCLVLLVLALMGPVVETDASGADVVVVVDRSESMPTGSENNPKEMIDLIAEARTGHSRLAVVDFAGSVHITQTPTSDGRYGGHAANQYAGGSDLAGAMETALNLIPEDRPGRILLITDGRYTGPSPKAIAHRAVARGIKVDYRFSSRSVGSDAAVTELNLPGYVSAGAPFQFSATVWSDIAGAFTYKLMRGNAVVATGRKKMKPGNTRLTFRDILPEGGIHDYQLLIDSIEMQTVDKQGNLVLIPGKDSVADNNIGRGVVRSEKKRGVLLVNGTGQVDNLAASLTQGGLEVTVVSAQNANLTLENLDAFAAVVLENVHARTIGAEALVGLSHYVNQLGGGLLMTGGEQSLGRGGYMASAIEDTLPVSMEQRIEKRKASVAMAIVLDRSGSMGVGVGGGKTKMDLANLGTVEALNMLMSYDAVSVIAVDSKAHIIQKMTTLKNKKAIVKRVLKIESMGGGIYVFTGLLAAGKELEKAKSHSVRHIVLFADAQDAEEPGTYKNLLKRFQKMGITVSVIGLGKDTDVDADFLKDVAKRGSGRVMFTESAKELPKLFAEETVSIAPPTFIKESTGTRNLVADGRLLGNLPTPSASTIPGYNITYLRPDATQAVETTDENEAPILAFWHRGLGRAAVIATDVDATLLPGSGTWPAPTPNAYYTTVVQWVVGHGEPPEYRLTCTREGRTVTATLELDPDKLDSTRVVKPTLFVVPLAGGAEKRVPLQWVADDKLEATFKTDKLGTYLTAARIDDRRSVRGTPVTLPYSPEFMPRPNAPDPRTLLEEIAKVTGGKARLSMDGVFELPGQFKIRKNITPRIMALLAILLILEIAGRRLALWGPLEQAAGRATAGAMQQVAQRAKALIPRKTKPLRKAPSQPPQTGEPPAEPPSGKAGPAPTATAPPKPEQPEPASALQQAKNKARKRTQR